jgi:hypothetical protein
MLLWALHPDISSLDTEPHARGLLCRGYPEGGAFESWSLDTIRLVRIDPEMVWTVVNERFEVADVAFRSVLLRGVG